MKASPTDTKTRSSLFDPEKSLFSLPVVWCSAGIPALIALVSAILIVRHTDLPWDLSGDGFTRFAQLYKFPAGMVAVGLALVGLCGANHRSEQTRKQIERTGKQIDLTMEQNIFSNYYKHVEEFGKFCSTLNVNANPKIEYKVIRTLHDRIYPEAKYGRFNISFVFASEIDRAIEKFLDLTGPAESLQERYEQSYELTKYAFNLAKKFGMHFEPSTSHQGYQVQDGTFNMPIGGWPKFFSDFIIFFEKIEDAFRFSENNFSLSSLDRVRTIDLTRVPITTNMESSFSLRDLILQK